MRTLKEIECFALPKNPRFRNEELSVASRSACGPNVSPIGVPVRRGLFADTPTACKLTLSPDYNRDGTTNFLTSWMASLVLTGFRPSPSIADVFSIGQLDHPWTQTEPGAARSLLP